MKKEYTRFVFALIKPYKKRIIIITLCMLAVACISMVNPIISRRIFDDGISKTDYRTVVVYSSILISLFFIEQLINFIQFMHYTYINAMIPYNLLRKAFSHSLKLKVSYYKDTNFTQVINNTYYDISKITTVFDSNVLYSLISVVKLVGGIIGLLLINWKLTLFILAVIPLKTVVVNFFTKQRRVIFKNLMKITEEYMWWLNETLNSVEIIKLWNLIKEKKRQFISQQRKILKINFKQKYLDQTGQIAQSSIDNIFYNLLYMFGAALIFRNEMTIGGMFSFIAYSSYVTNPISLLTFIRYQLAEAAPSFERYINFMQNETEYQDMENMISVNNNPLFPQKISFDNVSLSYSKNEALHSLSFDVKKGEKVAIIGNNGSGKTSLINLLLRFYEPTQGAIFMDDINISNIKMDEYRSLFSVMTQHPFMFNASIENNIDLTGKMTDDELQTVCTNANILSFTCDLPEGIETKIGYNGSKLSGGQRQKIALARTFGKKSAILLLDEATASFDSESEAIFNEYIKETCKYDFIIVITHRPSILSALDKIVYMENGYIKDIGTYDELIKRYPVLENQLINNGGT